MVHFEFSELLPEAHLLLGQSVGRSPQCGPLDTTPTPFPSQQRNRNCLPTLACEETATSLDLPQAGKAEQRAAEHIDTVKHETDPLHEQACEKILKVDL